MSSKSITIKDFELELPGAISSDKLSFEFNPVVSINRHEKEITWIIYVRIVDSNTEEFVPIISDYFRGRIPSNLHGWIKVDSRVGDGVIKKSEPTIITSGKNIGKKNETNPFTQALRDALGKYTKQKQKSDSPGIELFPPMLSQSYDESKLLSDNEGKLQSVHYVQRKYNGVRAVAMLTGENVILYSRTRKVYPGYDYLTKQLKTIYEYLATTKYSSVYFDGELYKHGLSLQTISGIARRENKDQLSELDYYIYDCFNPVENRAFEHRLAILDDIKKHFMDSNLVPNIVFVPTYSVKNVSEINELYDLFLSENYEGAMIRINTKYEYSYNQYHSSQLLKKKPAEDAEFKIIDYTCGTKGKAKGMLMFIVEIAPGKTMPVSINMTINERKDLFEKMSNLEENAKTYFENNFKDRYLTITFDELSNDGIPVRARADGIVIRDDL